MVREDILEGLRVALHRGESLKQAMMTFYNSGYNNQEIEEAARALQIEEKTSRQTFQNNSQQISQEQSQQIQPPTEYSSGQVVSNYGNQENQKKPPRKLLIILVVILLVVFAGLLTTIFVFWNEFSSLLSGLF